MPIIQFRIDHKTIVDRQEKLIRYINKNVHLIGGIPNKNCLPISLFVLGLITEEYVLNSTLNKCGTSADEIKYVTQCALGDGSRTVLMHYTVTPDVPIDEIYIAIGNQLENETATVIIVEGRADEFSHAVVFYKNGLGELKIIDTQNDLFDGDYNEYPDNNRISKVFIAIDPFMRGVIERVNPCKVVPMILDGGKRLSRVRRPLSLPKRKGRHSSSAKKRRYTRRRRA